MRKQTLRSLSFSYQKYLYDTDFSEFDSAEIIDYILEKSVSCQKKDGRGHMRPSFFWCDNDKDLKVCFLVTRVLCDLFHILMELIRLDSIDCLDITMISIGDPSHWCLATMQIPVLQIHMYTPKFMYMMQIQNVISLTADCVLLRWLPPRLRVQIYLDFLYWFFTTLTLILWHFFTWRRPLKLSKGSYTHAKAWNHSLILRGRIKISRLEGEPP